MKKKVLSHTHLGVNLESTVLKKRPSHSGHIVCGSMSRNVNSWVKAMLVVM